MFLEISRGMGNPRGFPRVFRRVRVGVVGGQPLKTLLYRCSPFIPLGVYHVLHP